MVWFGFGFINLKPKNRAKLEKTKPKPSQTSLNRFLSEPNWNRSVWTNFDFFKKINLIIFFIKTKSNRHSRVIRLGTANPFFPVQIWMSPCQKKNTKFLILFCWYIVPNRDSGGKRFVIFPRAYFVCVLQKMLRTHKYVWPYEVIHLPLFK